MRQRFGFAGIIVILTVSAVSASVHLEIGGGCSFQSAYQYFEEEPVQEGVEWVTFDPLNAFAPSIRMSIDTWADSYRMGVTAGFLRRYGLTLHHKSGGAVVDTAMGEMLAIPMLGYVEGHAGNLFFEFGLGPFLTRFNYSSGHALPEFSVTSLFGFLFGTGYEFAVSPAFTVVTRGELLLNAPVKVVDYLDDNLKRRVEDSRYTMYNVNEFQSVIYNEMISVAVQYSFGNKVRIPLEKMLHLFAHGKE